ncbi:MAG: hypothetical protein PHU71_07170, partial [Candidatus Gracilibacteria bacterium]|nr:hypothetical protein [Candidatus Gracilibacteria bacterium]
MTFRKFRKHLRKFHRQHRKIVPLLGILATCLLVFFFLYDEPELKTVLVTDRFATFTIESTRETIGEALRDNGFELFESDLTYPPMTDTLHN